jgi:hypothetical protein
MISEYPKEIVAGMGARYIDGVFFNIFGVYSISYLTQQLKVPRTEALLGVTAAALIMCAFIPFFGIAFRTASGARTSISGVRSSLAFRRCPPSGSG